MKKLVFLALLLLGIVICLPGLAAADLVTNGGFETGTFSGWTINPDPLIGTGVSNDAALNGSTFGAYFAASVADESIAQALHTTIGQTYQLDFWYANNGGPANHFIASLGGTPLLQLTGSDLFDSTPFSYQFTATDESTILQFAGFNGPGAYYLDDVSVNVAAVPLPPSALLLGSGLLGLVGLRRRFKK